MKLGIKVQIISIVVLCVNFKFDKPNNLLISQIPFTLDFVGTKRSVILCAQKLLKIRNNIQDTKINITNKKKIHDYGFLLYALL
jgi:hypothetical protein